jgi:hypothetical protein
LIFCIEELKDKGKLTMIQLYLLTCLIFIPNFGDEIRGKRKFLTPGKPKFKIQRSAINMHVLDAHYHRRYRSGFRMLLYSTGHSCPDIYDFVQELSKCMDSATWGSHNELLRLIIYVIDNKLLV